jgi:hypothetical protein
MTSGTAIRTPVLLAALAGIAVLAIGLPFGAVHALHAHRLERADADLRRIATGLAGRALPDAAVLVGPGNVPQAVDPRWTAGPALPLSGMDDIGPDPWGNAYLVTAAASGATWVLSAGPDGIIQTPFAGEAPAGDDRAAAVR